MQKGEGCSSEILNYIPKREQSGCSPGFFLTPKRDHIKHKEIRNPVTFNDGIDIII